MTQPAPDGPPAGWPPPTFLPPPPPVEDGDGTRRSEALESLLRTAGADVTLTTVEGAEHIFFGAATGPIVADGAAFLARHLRASRAA